MRTIRCSGDASAGSVVITKSGTATTQTERAAMANILFARVASTVTDAGVRVIAASMPFRRLARAVAVQDQ